MKGLTLTKKEQTRLRVMNAVLERQWSAREAAELLGVSERHTWRILAAYRKEGAVALAHGNRGRCPANTTGEETRRQVITLASERYVGLNHTHLTELLAEREGVVLARATVRRILVSAGLKSPRQRRPPRHRCRRARMPQEGMLVQIDGSHHDWLEGRGSWLTLLLAVDDATGTVPHALFREQEDTQGYFLLLRGIIQRRGIPVALYTDRHAVFQHSRQASEAVELALAGESEPTQFGRAMQELGVSQIFARSPEAKGRVERQAGTFQDRLVSELRLANASTEADANRVLEEFLPRFNQRFGVPAAQPGCAYCPADPEQELGGILCFKHHRKVARDNTVKYRWRTLQLLPGSERTSYAQARVEVQERLDGSLVAYYQGHVIPTQEAPARPAALRAGNGVRSCEPTTTPLCLTGGVSPNGAQGQDGVEVLGAAREEAAAGSFAPVRSGRSHSLHTPRHRSLKPQRRGPTPRQQARWEIVQAAKRRGMSLRAITRLTGIARNTVQKYAAAASPPMYPERRPQARSTATVITPEKEDFNRQLTESLITKP